MDVVLFVLCVLRWMSRFAVAVPQDVTVDRTSSISMIRSRNTMSTDLSFVAQRIGNY